MDNNEFQSLVTTADNLVKRLREIGDDPRYTAVWQFWANHGMTYNGPFYVEELDSLERSLKHFTNESAPRADNGGSSAAP